MNGRLKQTKGIRRPGQKFKEEEIAKKKAKQEADEEEFEVVTQDRTTSSSTKRGKISKVRARNKRKLKHRYTIPLLILFVMFLLVLVFFSSYVSYTYLIDKYNSPIDIETIYIDPETSVKFRIEKGSTSEQITADLYEMGLIQNEFVYKFLSKFNGYDNLYKAGTYTLCEGLTYDEIMVILSGTPETVRVTFPEGFTTLQIAERLESNGVVDAKEFLYAIDHIDLSSYAFVPAKTENRDYRLDGYLFPDTYEFDVQANVEDVIYKFLNRFNEVFLPSYYSTAQSLGLTVDEIMILASIVEKEAKIDGERAKIAGVFLNRVNSPDVNLHKWESCATVRYVYKKLYGIDLINITLENEKEDDPYNTYMYEGFVPGPICNPGLKSIQAALIPEEHEYYYFVYNAKDGVGTHIFSHTYAEHLKAKEQYG
ncbi:MAG: endolytic transglycosylase MltG [Ruminococcaceae bacterium]|nr:endolytic transglycosylase MltG [Oscillospiraceae bacterium]